jgi:hypothetical protein
MLHLNGQLAEGPYVIRRKNCFTDPYAFAMTCWTQNLPKTSKDYHAIEAFIVRMLADADVAEVMGV